MIYLNVDLEPENISELSSELNQIKGFLKSFTQSEAIDYQKAFSNFEKLVQSVNNALS